MRWMRRWTMPTPSATPNWSPTSSRRKPVFLFISHNKIAMEMAEQLIGVTMQEQGVSRIVAVDMEAALGFSTVTMAQT